MDTGAFENSDLREFKLKPGVVRLELAEPQPSQCPFCTDRVLSPLFHSTLAQIKDEGRFLTRFQGTMKWNNLREEFLTASTLNGTRKDNSHRIKNFRERTGFDPKFKGNKYTTYGNEYEAEAISEFCRATGHNVLCCGLVQHPDQPFLAGSPDALTYCGMVVEVKCKWNIDAVPTKSAVVPKMYRDQMQLLMDIFRTKKSVLVRYYADRKINGKRKINILEYAAEDGWLDKNVLDFRIYFDHACIAKKVRQRAKQNSHFTVDEILN